MSIALTEIDQSVSATLPSASASVSVECWDGRRRDEALAAWFALEARLGDLPVACSADWTELWLRHYGDLVPHRFVVGCAEGRLVGIVLLTRGVDDRDGVFPVRTWHLGTAGEADADSLCIEYNAVACEPAYQAAFLRATFEWLEDRRDWDELRCDGFADVDLPLGDETVAKWSRIQRSARWTDLQAVRATGQELITVFGDSTRKSIRQNLRDCGPLDVRIADSVATARRFFDELVVLHQARWNSEGQPGCYHSRAFTAFHRELIERWTDSGRVLLIRVAAGDVTFGCTQFYIDRSRALNYQGGRLASVKKHSPGLVTDYACMQACLQRGYAAYDFMAGDSMHKQRLTTEVTPLSWCVRRRPTWKSAVMRHFRRCRNLLATWTPGRGATP